MKIIIMYFVYWFLLILKIYKKILKFEYLLLYYDRNYSEKCKGEY